MLPEDIIEITQIEQKFGKSYSNFASLYLDLELYKEYRWPYLEGLSPKRSSIPGINCTLDTLSRAIESIKYTSGSETVREQMLKEVETEIGKVKKYRRKIFDLIVKREQPDMAYEHFRNGVLKAGKK